MVYLFPEAAKAVSLNLGFFAHLGTEKETNYGEYLSFGKFEPSDESLHT